MNASVTGSLSSHTLHLYFLHAEGYLEKDITAGLKVIRSEKKTVIPLSAREIALVDGLFNVKTYLGCRNYCIVHLMLDAGLRSNEVCTLRIHDVNFDNKLIRVFGKGSKERVIPMARNLRKYLYEYVYLHRKAVGTDLFFAREDAALSDNVVKSLFARIRRRTGIERIKPHLLRHTFATCFILDGGSVEMLRILMGHESITTTQMYLHLASVYEFNEDPYELDPIFFSTYQRRKRR